MNPVFRASKFCVYRNGDGESASRKASTYTEQHIYIFSLWVKQNIMFRYEVSGPPIHNEYTNLPSLWSFAYTSPPLPPLLCPDLGLILTRFGMAPWLGACTNTETHNCKNSAINYVLNRIWAWNPSFPVIEDGTGRKKFHLSSNCFGTVVYPHYIYTPLISPELNESGLVLFTFPICCRYGVWLCVTSGMHLQHSRFRET
jgi:hypothetical protein